MDYEHIPYKVAPMRISDIPQVMDIERQAFPTPWPASAYRYEIEFNSNAHYYAVRPRRASPSNAIQGTNGWWGQLRRLFRPPKSTEATVLGYVGFWLVAGEAHISTIAVDPAHRRRGLGELLLVRVIEDAIEFNADFVTLEMRVSNQPARHLYEKYGFERRGRRKGYYSDNREDAWIMTVDQLESPEFQALLRRNKRALRQKLLSSHSEQQQNQPDRHTASHD